MTSRTERFYLLLLGVSTGGAMICYISAGWLFADGFLFGAALAALNQWILRLMVRRMTPGEGTRPGLANVTAVVVGSRYLLLGAIGYAIVKYSGVSAISVLTGCFVALAALILDFLFELKHGS